MELVTPSIGLIFWMTLAFLGLLFILTKFAWKPILKMVKDREHSIEEALKAADNARQDMADLKKHNESMLAEARKERDVILKEAREIKETMINDAKSVAQKEADKLISSAREAIQTEKNAAMADIKNQVAVLSLQIAEKILKTELSSDDKQKALISTLLNDVKLN